MWWTLANCANPTLFGQQGIELVFIDTVKPSPPGMLLINPLVFKPSGSIWAVFAKLLEVAFCT